MRLGCDSGGMEEMEEMMACVARARSVLPRHSTTAVEEVIARCSVGMSVALPMVTLPSLETLEAPMASESLS